MQTTTKIIFLLLLIFDFYVPAANAEPITINLTATVNYIEGAEAFGGAISVGSIITGSYTYESTTSDSSPSDPVGGHYWHYVSPYGVSLTASGFNFKTDPANVNFLVGIGNEPSDDSYWFISYNNLSLSESVGVGSIAWQLNDYTANVFLNDALPATAPILNQWQNNDLMIDGTVFGIHANVISAELVPEPGTLLLLTFGALAIRKRRHFQN